MAVQRTPAFPAPRSRLTESDEISLQGMVTGDGISDLDELPEPWVIAHRGAGAMLAPDGQLSSYLLGVQWGTGIVDGGDWCTTADGGCVDCHDSTLDRTTTATGNVSAATAAQLARVTVDASSWFGGGAVDTVGLLTPEVFFTAMRGLAVVCPQPNDLAAAHRVATVIERLGMQKMVLPNSFTTAWLSPFRDIGCPYLFRNLLSGEHATFDEAMAETFRAAGVTHVGVDRANANAVAAATAVIANGFKLVVGTISCRAHKKPFAGLNVAGWVSDDPLWTNADPSKYKLAAAPFAKGAAYYHGDHDSSLSTSPGAGKRGTYDDGLILQASSTSPNFKLQGWLGPYPSESNDYTLPVDIDLITQVDDKTRWPSVVVCCPDDLPYTDTGSTSNGYQIWVNPSTAAAGGAPGQISIRKKVAGAGVGPTATGALSAEWMQGQRLHLDVRVTPTSIIVTASGAATGTATLVDSTWRRIAAAGNEECVHFGHAGWATGFKVEFNATAPA